jgi:hypothetical protein
LITFSCALKQREKAFHEGYGPETHRLAACAAIASGNAIA